MARHRHLTRRTLIRLLNRASTEEVVDRIDDCEQCSSLLEAQSQLPASIRTALINAVTPPPDLAERTLESVAGRIRLQESAAAFTELFGIGWRTSRVLLDPSAASEPKGTV